MMKFIFLIIFIMISSLISSSTSFIINSKIQSKSACSTKLFMGPVLYGAQQTRSPLVNWYLIENKIPFIQKPPRPSNHPFGQSPYLTDDDGVEIFESGAILLYLSDKYVSKSAIERASWTKWVVWANSELEELCFGPGFSGPLLEKDKKALTILEEKLGTTEWLVDNKFSVADVAVASYLNYVPVFFGKTNLSKRPNMVKYMARCASRPAFSEAFGKDHSDLVIKKSEEWLGSKKIGFW